MSKQIVVIDRMTSELVFKSHDIGDEFGTEFVRRMGLLGFSKDVAQKFYEQEKAVLASSVLADREEPWAVRYYFPPEITVATLPQVEALTLSELISMTDDANSAFVRDHEWMSGDAFAAVCVATTYGVGTAKYAYAMKDRVKEMGWSPEQEGAFVRNECLLMERLKWGTHDNPAWNDKTTSLDQYKR